MKIIRKILWLLFLFSVIGAAFVFGYYYAVTKNVTLRPERLILSDQSIHLYDAEKQEIKYIQAENFKQTTKICDIPNEVKQAFITVEDKRFYSHNGFDFKRILGATIKNMKAHSFKEGASTISQQLIKNTHLSHEKTLKRKLQEWKLTNLLEKKYTKDEILEKYLNSIYFGHSCFGITSAANFYFGKTPNQLTLSDAAILAGLVKSPNHYSPFRNPQKCKQRKACVLSLMRNNDCINDEAYEIALREELPTQQNNHAPSDYAHFVFDELTEIAESKQFKLRGKIEIFTYLDPNLQTALNEISNQHTESDKAFMVLDNQSLGFKACISTIGNARRLPGSLIKPLLVYGPALEENLISPATPILDKKINYSGYQPENYDGMYHGYVSARECIEKSLNIPAVKTLESLGTKTAIKYMEKLHLPIAKDDESLALALGGMKNGFTLSDITSAYATFANDGQYGEGKFISSIKINGTNVYTRKKAQEKVFSMDSAYLMTDMLKSTTKSGTAKKMRNLPFEIAAKTGTVGTDNGNTDAYTISYTSKDCVAVWLGNATNDKIPYTGGGLPCNYALKINEYLYNAYIKKKQNIPPFMKSSNIVNVSLDKSAYYDTHTILLADEQSPPTYRFNELFKKSNIPLNKSDIFSSPSIVTPNISVKENAVTLTFDPHSPSFYEYQIIRKESESNQSTILYHGPFTPSFSDNALQSNKVYIYTVIPIFKNNTGKPIILPSISTKDGLFSKKEEKILEENWWDY